PAERPDEADEGRGLRKGLRLRPRGAGSFFRSGVPAGCAESAPVLRTGAVRVRARRSEAAGLVGSEAVGTGWRDALARRGLGTVAYQPRSRSIWMYLSEILRSKTGTFGVPG